MTQEKPPVVLTLITGQNCPLCDEMKSVIENIRSPFPFIVQEVPVDTSAELFEAYGTRYPYLFVAGSAVAKGFLDSNRLSARIVLHATVMGIIPLPEVVAEAIKKIG